MHYCQPWRIFSFTLILLIVALYNGTSAQNQSFSFIKVNINDDLPDNTVEYIFQDNNEFIWLCTGKGLVRYDGNTFETFTLPDNNANIDLKKVIHVMQDDENRFWISTSNNGIIIYNPENENWKNFNFLPISDGTFGSNNIHHCFQDSKGRIWVCSLGSGIYLWLPQKQQFKNFQHNQSDANSLPNNHVTFMVEDVSGHLWIACNGKSICRFDPESEVFTPIKTHFEGLNMGAYYKQLYFTNANTLWISTYGTGIYKLNTETLEFKRYYQDFLPASLNCNYVKGMIPDLDGNLLFITDGGGINIFDTVTQHFTHITYNSNEKRGLTTNALYSIYKDADENIWLGTFKSGLFLLKKDSRTLQIVTEGNNNTGLSHKSVLSILKDSEGILWYGTDGGGLNCFDPETGKYTCYQFYSKNNHSISDNVIKDIYEDKDGTFWIATFFGGLNRFDPHTKRFTQYKTANSLSENSISSNNSWCIMEDHKNILWIGNFSTGIDLFDKNTGTFTPILQNYDDTNSLSHTQVSAMVQDTLNNIWIGTLNGLNEMDYDTKKCKRYMNNPNDSTSLNDNVITCLLYSSKKQLWIGTSTGGLSRMIKPGIFKAFKGSNALHNYSVQSIEEDSSENIWISTNKGLYKFDPVLELFYSMDDAEDFIGNEYNWNSSYFDNTGNLYFGSINGVCVFKPNIVEFNKSFPGIKFTNIKVFDKDLIAGKEYHGRVLLNKSIIYGGAITLTAKENAFTIDFAAIEYDNAHKIQYKYKLEGFDNEYQITGAKKRNATYTNLPGAKYVFNLTSTNSNGVWNTEFIKLNITVLPPYYKTWWFKWAMFMVVLLMAYLIYKRNIEKHKQIIREEGLMREKKLTVQRNSELRNEIASNTVLLLQKNESFEMIKDKLNELEYNELNKQKVKELIELVEHQKDVDTYWQQFQFNFDNAYHNLLTRLKETYPDLTKTNLKLCAYLHLNLSSKEIASLMNVTISGIDKARNRLRKKLNLQPTDDLCEFLNSF